MRHFNWVVLAALVVLLAAPAMAEQPCPQGHARIYQYSVNTTVASHHDDFPAVATNANNYCDNKYGANSMGASIELNAQCNKFLIHCLVCGSNVVGANEYPMALEVAVDIANGTTGGGTVIDVDQIYITRFGKDLPAFRVDYLAADGVSGGIDAVVDATTGQVEILEPQTERKLIPLK